MHPSVFKINRKRKSKAIKNEMKKRRTDEDPDASTTAALQFTESSSSDTVDMKKELIDESDASTSAPQLTKSSSDTVDLTLEEDQDTAVSSQVSSTSNRNYLGTGKLENDVLISSNSQNDMPNPNDMPNQNDAEQVEVTPDLVPEAHAGVYHTLMGLHNFIHPMAPNEKIDVCNFIDLFVQTMRTGIATDYGRAN